MGAKFHSRLALPCLLLAGVNAAVALAGGIQAEPPAPSAEAAPVPGFFHDFGTVIEGDSPTHTFSFANTTDTPLSIRSVRVPCGCAKTSVARNDLAPGESTAFTVTFASKGLRGRVAKHIYVLTDASDLAMVKYTLQATVEPRPAPQCIVPGSLHLGSLTVNQIVEATLPVENRGTLDLNVAPGVVPRGIVLVGEFPMVVPPGKKAELKLAYTAPFHKGRQRDNLQLKTNDPLRPEVWVVIQAETAAAKTKNPVPPLP
jgi:hypothetical protein